MVGTRPKPNSKDVRIYPRSNSQRSKGLMAMSSSSSFRGFGLEGVGMETKTNEFQKPMMLTHFGSPLITNQAGDSEPSSAIGADKSDAGPASSAASPQLSYDKARELLVKQQRNPSKASLLKVPSNANKNTKSPEYDPFGEFKIHDILEKRVVNGVTQYLIRWEGYGDEDNTWELEEDVVC